MRTPESIKDKPELKGSFRALRFIPRFFMEIWRTNRFLFLSNLLCRLLNAFVPIALLWVGKLIIDEIVLQVSLDETDLSALWMYVGAELVLALLSDLLSRAIGLTDGLLGDLYANASSIIIIRKTKDITISQLEDPDFYDKLERARQQTTSRVNLMSESLTQVENIISMISLIAGLIYFEPWLLILLVLSIIPSFINEIKFSSRRYSLARSWTAERRELDYLRYIGANDQTAREVKLFGISDFIAGRFQKVSDEYYQLNKALAIRQTSFGAVFNMLGVLSYYGAYVLIILRVIAGVLTLGDLTFLSGSFNRLRGNLQGFFLRFTRITERALYLRDYFDFIDLVVEDPSDQSLPVPKVIREGFKVKNLSFAYPGSAQNVLTDVSFTLRPGEKMAFVGQNGAGKTTLIKLFLRFYEPTSGEITLEGVNISRYNRDQYQQLFGVIFQDFFKYEFTMRENIAVGNIDELENMERIEVAAERSLASEVISELELGLDQQLGRRFAQGKELSGGQWQKVALARAYMKDANVLILDEPTAALDAKAEYEVFQRFIGLTQDKTSIIISHRFSTVRMADRILVLREGRLEELGTHEELMQNKGLYAELFELQAAGYR
ncbi:ABC transporter ATP-binding protein [Fulvivirga sedimenti]|uniref:ABC transporter ATP-binding protein/permease n=1 Tax=Fulvivirga sedimenti TaxID=2879465 RepID=A0A9X1KXF5_9BACT|nr:ABC transporter ATP-binding protein [Fulvivirga sedimenti]MCA6074683.1 ABC transporter ATP-binding protein/permease [Fulvivirga sedimenti]MCA6075860.1 ABC transporter ATP-binding protein/permease [Fulvivirga sedimenti]MCA6076988.1 ABC transporter ATP-binding protein/permease [Fulvivirga sedimenti]